MSKNAPDAIAVAEENGWILLNATSGVWYAKIGNRAAYGSTPENALCALLNRYKGEVRYNGLLLKASTVVSYLMTHAQVATPDREEPPLVESGDEPPAEGTPEAGTSPEEE